MKPWIPAVLTTLIVSFSGLTMASPPVGGYKDCPCTIAVMRTYQTAQEAYVYLSGTRHNTPTCVAVGSSLGNAWVIDIEAHPGIYAAVLAAFNTGQTLSRIEGSGACSIKSGVEDLGFIELGG